MQCSQSGLEMSTITDPGAQNNPEQEQGKKRETLSTRNAALPLSMKLDNGHGDEAHGARPDNGVNGVHHHDGHPEAHTEPQDETQADTAQAVTPQETTSQESSGQDGVESVEASAVENPALDSTATSTPESSSADAASTDDVMLLRTPRSAVKIKGRPGGVSLELGEGDWKELMVLLKERLEAAEGFFRGGRVLLEVGTRPVTEEQLRQVQQLLETHEMKLAVVRSTAERTLQAADEVGIATTVEETQEALQVPEPPLIVADGPPNAYTPSPYAPPPEISRPNHFVHRGSLRSGQVLRKTESIVVIGDVNPGAQVVSGGDIMVWGRLRGIAHAGAEGNRRAVVAAIDFVPTQLRIANLTAIAPDEKRKKARGVGLMFWKKEPERRPEIARVIDGRIVVEPWDEGGKPNGLGVWRR